MGELGFMRFLDNDLIQLNVKVNSAEEAITEAGNILLKEGVIESTYIEAMVDAYKKNGPYFVLAPHIAIPHARPEDGVNEASVSLVRLEQPIEFGHDSNDPVQMVFGLGASSNEEHLTLLRKLTTLLNDPERVDVLKNSKDINEIQKTIEMGM